MTEQGRHVFVCLSAQSALPASLKEMGWKVKLLLTRESAIEALESDYPAVVIIDQHFDGDGFAFCEVLRGKRGYQDKPVLLLIDDIDVETSKALGNADGSEFELNASSPAAISLRLSRMVKTARKAKQNKMALPQQLSITDALTGLHNRQYFKQFLDDNLSRAKQASVPVKGALLLIDIDDFKRINSSFDYQTGDYLLKLLSDRLTSVVRDSDLLFRDAVGTLAERMVTRHGGDEFTLYVNGVDDKAILSTIAQRVLSAISAPITFGDHHLVINASIGIACFDEGNIADALLCNAEQAMYEAKNSTSERVAFFRADMESAARTRFTIESDMRKALERGEFSLHYQPQIETSTGKIVRMEALCRWYHCLQGPISPVEFIPVAEKSGLILTLGSWVIAEACRQMREWKDLGIDCKKIAVNVSASQFYSADFVDTVTEALRANSLHGSHLELELTESIFIQDVEQNIAKLQQLKALGVTLAVDDFGTGYSSLSYLKRLPIDIIKIEKSFISQIHSHPAEKAIVEAILALADRLEFQVVAEGVEDLEQLSYLKSKGCDFLQGFLLGRPVGNVEAEALFNQVVDSYPAKEQQLV